MASKPRPRRSAYGTISARGGHGDPTATATVLHVGLGERVREHVSTAWWLTTSAHRHQPLPTGPALAVLTRALADVDPDTAHEAGRYLERADKAARRALWLGDDHWPLPGNPRCPACGVRMLRARTSNPDSSSWPIICNAKCVCAGNACPCGMTTRQKRTPHIWHAASDVIQIAIRGVSALI